MKVNYPLATSSWDNKEIQAIQNVINSGIFTMGKNVELFEKRFSEYVGSKYCVMVNSGSSANLLMIAALFYTKENKLKPGDEVIVPAVSWSTTYYPLYQYGLKIKFVDIDLQTLNFDLNQLAQAITDNTRLILAVNLLGNPNDFDQINSLIKNKNITLLEDNCESMGSEYKGKKTGTFGKMGSFSTFFSHHISTMEGGAVVTDDEELYHILLCLRAHGWTRNLPKKNYVTGIKREDPFEESFKFVLPGYNVRPLEMSGAIGLEQINKLSSFIENRRKNAKVFYEFFQNDPNFIIQREIGESSWFGFSFVLRPESELKRADVINQLQNSGVEVRPIVTGNFVKNPVIQYMNYEVFGDLKHSEYMDVNGFFVGNHHYNITQNIKYLSELLREI